MVAHLSFPSQDSYAEVSTSNGKTFYIFQEYHNNIVHNPNYILRSAGGKTNSIYPFVKAHSGNTRDTDLVLVNLFQIVSVSSAVYVDYPTDLSEKIASLDVDDDSSIAELKQALNNYYVV